MFETSCGFGVGMSVHPKKEKVQYNIQGKHCLSASTTVLEYSCTQSQQYVKRFGQQSIQ